MGVALIKMSPNVLYFTEDWGNLKYQGLDHRIYNLNIKLSYDNQVVTFHPAQWNELSTRILVLGNQQRRNRDPNMFSLRAQRLQSDPSIVQLLSGQSSYKINADIRQRH